MQVAEADTLSQCLLATGFPYDRAATADNNLAEFSYFMPKTRGVRRAGSAALDIGWVAAGRLNGYWERGVQVWDVAAGVLMVREAGGVVTTYQGDPWQPGDRFAADRLAQPASDPAARHHSRTRRCDQARITAGHRDTNRFHPFSRLPVYF